MAAPVPIALVEAARDGGPAEIERLVEAIWPDAHRLARAISGERQCAEDDLLQYDLPGAWRRSDHVLTLVIANPKTLTTSRNIARGDYELSMGSGTTHGRSQWMIGGEEVIVMSSTITPAERTGIKNAMVARSRHPAR